MTQFTSNGCFYNQFVGFMKNDIHMKLPEGFNLSNSASYGEIKLNKFLYGLKQLGCMWYNNLSEYFLK